MSKQKRKILDEMKSIRQTAYDLDIELAELLAEIELSRSVNLFSKEDIETLWSAIETLNVIEEIAQYYITEHEIEKHEVIPLTLDVHIK